MSPLCSKIIEKNKRYFSYYFYCVCSHFIVLNKIKCRQRSVQNNHIQVTTIKKLFTSFQILTCCDSSSSLILLYIHLTYVAKSHVNCIFAFSSARKKGVLARVLVFLIRKLHELLNFHQKCYTGQTQLSRLTLRRAALGDMYYDTSPISVLIYFWIPLVFLFN